jgi:hypothetical protein
VRRLFLITGLGEIEIDPIFWPNVNWYDPRWIWK